MVVDGLCLQVGLRRFTHEVRRAAMPRKNTKREIELKVQVSEQKEKTHKQQAQREREKQKALKAKMRHAPDN
jgi:hypothetical protein